MRAVQTAGTEIMLIKSCLKQPPPMATPPDIKDTAEKICNHAFSTGITIIMTGTGKISVAIHYGFYRIFGNKQTSQQ